MTFPDACGLNEAFYVRIVDLGERGGWEPRDMGGMFCSESGLRWNIRNSIGAAGLSQLLPRTLRNLGFDEDKHGHFELLPAEEQIVYTASYFGWWREHFHLARFVSRAHLYQCNFMPATLEGDYDEDEVLVDRKKWAVGYDANAVLDANHDKVITVRELETTIARAVALCRPRYDAFCTSLDEVRGRLGKPETSPTLPGTGRLVLETVDGLQSGLRLLASRSGAPYFDHEVTGYYGPVTRDAVSRFQAEHGCRVDGWSGNETRAALRDALLKKGISA